MDAWNKSQLDRRAQAEQGRAVVANMRSNGHGQRIDEALLTWAAAEGRLVRIDRASEFGNPFRIPNDGDRDTVVAKFETLYWPTQAKLLAQVPHLRGKVLMCWCYPQKCHGDVIANTVNK